MGSSERMAAAHHLNSCMLLLKESPCSFVRLVEPACIASLSGTADTMSSTYPAKIANSGHAAMAKEM